jgi:HK97 family phage prohead protease
MTCPTIPPALERRDAPRNAETRAFAFDLKAASEDGTIEGYGSVFGVKDAYADIVAAGAFAETLAAHKAAGTMPAMLWQHDSAEPIGVWTDMVEDERGLRVKGQIVMETERGKAAHALLKKGALRGLSIGFVSKEWSYDREADIRTLTKVDLWEVSLVTFPANGKAMVDSVKCAVDAIATPKDAERALREAGFPRSDATALVSRIMRMGEERREAAQSTAELKRAAERLLNIISH